MIGSGSNGSEGRKGMDTTVGGLVWVRRRNGSWWPGQIVGLDDIPENGLASPRSGTPIKLLGRDDSSVELHDLEKTKGVKAFRCGDYDSCIEKAKASTATSSKRSVKYPRRENAIICALEIERTSLFKSCPDLRSPSNNSEGVPLVNGGDCSSKETTSAREENSNSTQELSHSGISYEETNESTYLKEQPFKVGRRKKKTPNDSEDDGSEGVKRMKGLDDLGILADRKVQVLALANPVRPNCTSLGSVANEGIDCMPTLKRKRSQVVHIHEILKRKYRRRPLTKVLENTTMVPVRIICDEFATPFERSDAISPSYECENGNKVKDNTQLFNVQLPEDDSSYMLFDVPFVDEDLHPSGFSPIRQPSKKPHTVAFRGGSSRASSFGHDHEALNGSGPIYSMVTRVNQKMETSASKWQSKGKRKARHLSKTEPLPPSPPPPHSRKKTEIDFIKSDPSRFYASSNGFINGFTERRKHISLASSSSSPRSFSYHQARFFGIYAADSSLYEVEITVEATRPQPQPQTQQVPYISLMSKLNGKPITGHPVAVEVLEDGFCDLQISDYPASGSCELDDYDDDDDHDTEMGRTKHIVLRPHVPHKKLSKSKRHGGPSSKKTRKLSSLTGPHKLNPEKRKPIMVHTSPKGPMLACVPLKVVFSRINEALPH